MLRFLSRNMLTGLVTILPIVLTLYILYWLAVTAESALGGLIRLILPDHWYRPGMGLTVGLVAVFAVGLLMHAYVVRNLFSKIEQLVFRVPLVKSVYRGIRDFLDYFSPRTEKQFDQVVSIRLGEMEIIGFVTQSDYERMPEDFRREDHVLVYLPLSYMIGGYTVLIPRSAVRPVDMSMDEAMKFALTAGITGNESRHRKQSRTTTAIDARQ